MMGENNASNLGSVKRDYAMRPEHIVHMDSPRSTAFDVNHINLAVFLGRLVFTGFFNNLQRRQAPISRTAFTSCFLDSENLARCCTGGAAESKRKQNWPGRGCPWYPFGPLPDLTAVFLILPREEIISTRGC
jgi:hypothetical protein